MRHGSANSNDSCGAGNMQVFYNLLTKDALLIYDEQAHPLVGPFASKRDAEQAAAELIERLEREGCASETRQPEPLVNDASGQPPSSHLPNRAVRLFTRGHEWIVQIIEEECTTQREFEVEEHANAYAAGQRIRLGLHSDAATTRRR